MKNILSVRGIFSSVNTRTIYAYSVLIGFLAGLGALAFNRALSAVTRLTMSGWANLPIPSTGGEVEQTLVLSGEPNRWLLLTLPVIGGLISGYLIKAFAPEAAGTGTDAYIDAFHNHGGRTRLRSSLIKALATIATLASGGSAGKEGPIAQIGSGIGSALGRFTKMGARARRAMLLAGAAGGLGAIFRAPLGGALTAVEVLYKEDLETDALTPCILSSVTAYTVFCSVEGFQHVFTFEDKLFRHPIELVFYAVLGLVCSGAGYLYVQFLHGSKDLFFDRLPLHPYLIPPLGGLMVGAVGFFYPPALGQGLGYVQALLEGRSVGGFELSIGMLALAALLKIMTTSFTISSGGSGGVFAPSLFIGAMLGGCVGQISQNLFPDLVPQVAPYVVVGMGAFFAGVANAPIASLLMVSELTGAYELLPPLLLVATISLIISRHYSIYTTQVDNKFFSRAHFWEMSPRWLKDTVVGDAFTSGYHRAAIVPNDLSYARVLEIAQERQQHDLILTDQHGCLTGLVALNDLAQREELAELGNLVLAQDLVNRRPMTLKPTDRLIRALEILSDREFDKIPVVSEDGGRELLGYLEYRDLLKLYALEREGASIMP